MQGRAEPIRYLLRDRDAKFPPAFDTAIAVEEVEVIRTPYRAPNANASAECWIRAAREEYLDQVLIVNEGHLRRVLAAYATNYNRARPHQGLDQQIRWHPLGILTMALSSAGACSAASSMTIPGRLPSVAI